MDKYSGDNSLWFKLRLFENVRSGNWRYPPGYLTSHLLLMNIDSGMRITVNGSLLRLSPGRAFIGLPGQLVGASSTEDGELFVVRFDAVEGESDGDGQNITERHCAFPYAGDILLSDAAGTGEFCRKAALDWRSEGTKGRLKALAAFHELLCRLLEDAGQEVPVVEEALGRTLAYMDRNYDRNITIDELAELAGLSRYYYMRLFKTSYGVSAIDYLTELRMNKAKRLMELSKSRLREIARQVGYSDEFYFIRKFKQQVGIPPATYIRNRKRRIAAYSYPNIGQLLALQIVPFAAPMDHGWTDSYRRKYRTDVVTALSHNCEFNLTALRAARPDYIIGVDEFLSPEEQERIRGIAPALFVSWRADDWRGHLQRISEFLDISQESESWLRKYDSLASRVREQVQRVVRQDKVLVVHRNFDGYSVYGRKTAAGVLYEDLSLSPAGRASVIERRELVTPGELAQFGADRILLMLPDVGDAGGAWERLQHSDDWRQTDEQLRDRVKPIAAWPWFDYSAHSQESFLLAAPDIFKA